MSNQEQESNTSETSEHPTTDEAQPAVPDERAEISTESPEPIPPNPAENTNSSAEQETTRQFKMPQDIRYSTEQDEREKLIKKYDHYQVSGTNSCNVRFLIDHRQKRNLLGRHEEENSTLQTIGQAHHVNMLPAYQNPPKHSYKMFGTEANIRECLIDILNRIFKQPVRSSIQPKPPVESEKTQETETEKQSAEPTEASESADQTDPSTTEEKTPVPPTTSSDPNEEKTDTKVESTDEEQYKFVPLELKREYTFILLITSQGQEVLKKNWNFFAGSLQQRLNVTVTNPLRLHKFGDRQLLYELPITGHVHENILDAALQINAFINDVLGVPTQPYKADEEQSNSEYNSHQRPRNSNQHEPHHPQQRRSEQNNNRHRNGIYEQMLLIRGDCVPRIVGTRGSTMRRIQSKCHLRDMNIARQPNENGYTECKLSAYQMRNLNYAIDTIGGYLRNENPQALQIFDAYYVELPSQSSPYQNDQLHTPNQNQEQLAQQTTLAFNLPPSELRHTMNETGFSTAPLQYNNSTQFLQPSYTFQNTPSFDFTHRPTSASRKNDKRSGDASDIHSPNNGYTRTSNENSDQQNGGSSSSSNSCSVSPRHKSKRTCPETKEIDCTTDEGFWIQKQYYYALDDQSKELFDSLMEKLDGIRIANEENAARKQQRLIGRNRASKPRTFLPSTTQSNNGNDFISNVDEEKKTEAAEEKLSTSTAPESTSI